MRSFTPTTPLRRTLWRSTFVFPLVAALLLTAGCRKKTSAEDKVTAEAESDPNQVAVTPALAANLRFGTPEMADVTGTLQVAARVETDSHRVAHVGSPVSGRILSLFVFEGQYVRAGTTLAVLHSTSLSDAQLALIKAFSDQSLASASVNRAEQLLQADVIGRAELERRRAELLQASAEVSSYQTQLRGLGMTERQIAELEKTRRLSANYPIITPRAGTILKREITVGQVIQPADPAFTIADLSSVWIDANVPEEDAGRLRQGMEVLARIPALGIEHLPGRVSYVSPIVDPSTRTVEVRMETPNLNGTLKPDELASMTFTGGTERKLTVPNTSVVREDDKDFVFVQVAPQKYALREVQLGAEQNDRRVVLGGVREGEHIVVDGAFHLNNQRKQNAIKGGA